MAGLIKSSSTVASLFQEIQQELLFRTSPVFITHIRTHSGLPGPMAQGNKMADLATRAAAFLVQDSIAAAAHFHSLFHVTAETLRKCFSISRAEARNIVLQCKNCSEFLPAPHVGINPRGLRPLQVWQMDVTHISSFGKLKYLHVSIDTCSGIIFASPQLGKTHLISSSIALTPGVHGAYPRYLKLIMVCHTPLVNFNNFVARWVLLISQDCHIILKAKV